MNEILESQRRFFEVNMPCSYESRMDALKRLENMVLHHQSALIEAVNQDFGRRAKQETQLLELIPLLSEIRHCQKHLKRWMRPKKVSVDWLFQPARAKIIHQPLGVIGIMGAWNYPISLILTPLANALAAGNCVMIKPSELAPVTSRLIATLIQQTFIPNQVTVVEGNAAVAAEFSALPFDHLVFTGSTPIGRKVLAAAAANLTPVTLELGGKSPAWVHESYDLDAAADQIITAKLWNAGQTCIAPDYVLILEVLRDSWVQAILRSLTIRFKSFADNPHYTHMINPTAWQRMREMVEDARNQGAQVITFNPENESTSEADIFLPTLLLNVTDEMRAMTEELFGPILPIVTYRDRDDAFRLIKQKSRPLALYYFDRDHTRVVEVINKVHAGGVAINECMLHYAQSNLPFGGVGASGMGAYHGHAGFLRFSKQTGVLIQNRWVAKIFSIVAKPPYSKWTERLVRFLLR